MRIGRLLRLLFFALPLVLGGAEGAEHLPATRTDSSSTIGTPRESLPTPVHDEATCAFCQSAIFPPCAAQATGISVLSIGPVQHERATPQAVAPHSTSHRATSSRAPPPLRSV
jgi:hypothetical protein